MERFEDVSELELALELVREQYGDLDTFMAQFIDHEADALPIEVQIKRVIKKEKTNTNV